MKKIKVVIYNGTEWVAMLFLDEGQIVADVVQALEDNGVTYTQYESYPITSN